MDNVCTWDRALTLAAGMGLGAGLMYILDPETGRRRRSLARDQAVSFAHQVQDTAGVVARDAQNRFQGLAHGDFSEFGADAMRRGLESGWSPTIRALMTTVGAGLFLFGLSRNAPTACALGTIGVALAVEGLTNATLKDIQHLPQTVSQLPNQLAGRLASSFGQGGTSRSEWGWSDGAREGRREFAGADI